jgi:predicted ATP-dependent endonuclease of OLD family
MGDNNYCTAEGFMLRDLSIQNYRCFKDFHIEGLARVNLIVGMNNSGKTSLLEAIYLLVNQGNPRCLSELLDKRGEILPLRRPRLTLGGVLDNNYQITHIFYGHQISSDQVIHVQSQQETFLSIEIQLCLTKGQDKLSEDIPETEDTAENDVSPFELAFVYEPNIKLTVPVLDDGSVRARSLQRAKQSQSHLFSPTRFCQFLTTDKSPFDELSSLWNKITLTPEYDGVVRALQILEPNVEGFSFTSSQTSNSGILLKMRGQINPIPLGSMGEGMRLILALTMAIVTLKNGFLLVDEIETGLYYEAQTDMWRLILEIAQQLNVQVFATTHSWDCISAFKEALDQLEDSSVGKLFRLSRKGENIRAVDYPAEKLSVAVRQNIEVR